jgi:hypothetical protein
MNARLNGNAGVKVTQAIALETHDSFHDMEHRKIALLSRVFAKVEHQDSLVVLSHRERSRYIANGSIPCALAKARTKDVERERCSGDAVRFERPCPIFKMLGAVGKGT